MEEKVQLWLHEHLPEGTTEHSFNLAYQCVSSVCHKYNWLNKTLHRAHNVRSSLVFKDLPKKFLQLAKTAYPWDPTTEYTPQFTGIPPHTVHLTKIAELKEKVLELENNIID